LSPFHQEYNEHKHNIICEKKCEEKICIAEGHLTLSHMELDLNCSISKQASSRGRVSAICRFGVVGHAVKLWVLLALDMAQDRFELGHDYLP
jgi:hypothetical protein